ncbi:MAG TPA: dynamin family protein, partial [Candidatus Dormibacteraeota bacterium]|nr:dynamin family protein [Candidatus Dormibacteraeota bacterium]
MDETEDRPDPGAHDDQGLLRALGTLARWGGLEAERRRQIAEAAAKLRAAVVHVAVVGDFKRGKSSLVNALVGQAVLPTGVIPVTAVPTLLRWGEALAVTVRFLDGREEAALPLQALASLVTEAGNPGNRRQVREVVVVCPAGLLRAGLVLVDLPGTG